MQKTLTLMGRQYVTFDKTLTIMDANINGFTVHSHSTTYTNCSTFHICGYLSTCMSIVFFLQKFESRKAAFLKTNQLSDAQRDVWRKVLIKDFISSEESGEESVDGEERQVIYVKTLPWRAPRVDRFFKKLDNKAARNKSRQSKQQTLPRVGGRRSGRSKPLGFTEDFFGFATA